MNEQERRAAYEASVSAAAAARQAKLTETHFVCCGQPHGHGHHPLCRNAPASPIEKPVPGQVALS